MILLIVIIVPNSNNVVEKKRVYLPRFCGKIGIMFFTDFIL